MATEEDLFREFHNLISDIYSGECDGVEMVGKLSHYIKQFSMIGCYSPEKIQNISLAERISFNQKYGHLKLPNGYKLI